MWWLGMATAMQLKELGEKLDAALADLADALAKLLKQAAECLHGIEQSPGSSVMETIQSCLKAITREELLKHQDEDVKVHLGTCFCEITRITAPKAPYSDDVLRRVAILETVARYRACVVMLDLECNDLNIDMF